MSADITHSAVYRKTVTVAFKCIYCPNSNSGQTDQSIGTDHINTKIIILMSKYSKYLAFTTIINGLDADRQEAD